MISTSQAKLPGLSYGRLAAYGIALIAIFVIVAIFCNVATSWISANLLKILIREIFLRVPLTFFALDLFSRKAIKTCQPGSIYAKLTLNILLKWTAIGFLLPVIAWLLCYSLGAIALFPHNLPMGWQEKTAVILKWTIISIAAGLTEEVLFRGYLLNLFHSRYSMLNAALITSVLFGAVHIVMLNSITPADVVISLSGGFVAGLMFCFIYFYTNNIWSAAMVHAIWDIFFIGKITAVAASQGDADHTILAFRSTATNILLTGDHFGIEATAPCLAIYIVVIVSLYLKRPMRRISGPTNRTSSNC